MLHQPPRSLISNLPHPAFALPRQDVHGASPLARISGKLSRFLARNIRTRTLVKHAAQPLITFTFDDAPASACSVGARILDQHGVRGTYYISGGGCGATSPGGRLASIDQVRALWKRGHEIACHTYSHVAVSSVSFRDLGSDLDRNRAFLKNIDGEIDVRNFAYPYGDLSLRTKRYLERRFDSCRSLIRGVNSGLADLGALKTWPLEDASADRAKIVELIAETVQTRGWLIFFSHDVDEQPSTFGLSPRLLTFAVAAAKAAGCTCVSVADGLKFAATVESVSQSWKN